jgi:predicted esterase
VERELASGEYCGLFGFSQGAMLAAVVAARASLGEGVSPEKCGFAVICGAAVPKPFGPLFARLPQAARAVPTLHCLARNDETNPHESGETLAAFFGDSWTLWHEEAHRVPTNTPEAVEAIVDWMEGHM